MLEKEKLFIKDLLVIRNLTQQQTIIILQNIQSPTFNISPVLDILDDKPAIYYKSAAFAYARDLYSKGADYAFAHLLENRADTQH